MSTNKTDIINNNTYVLFSREIDRPYVVFPVYYGVIVVSYYYLVKNFFFEWPSIDLFTAIGALAVVLFILCSFLVYVYFRIENGAEIAPYGQKKKEYYDKYKFGCSDLLGFYPKFHVIQFLIVVPGASIIYQTYLYQFDVLGFDFWFAALIMKPPLNIVFVIWPIVIITSFVRAFFVLTFRYIARGI